VHRHAIMDFIDGGQDADDFGVAKALCFPEREGAVLAGTPGNKGVRSHGAIYPFQSAMTG
jgi:hypothetical protein